MMIGLLFCMSYNSAKNVSFILSVHKRPCLPAPFFAKNKNFNFLMERLRDMPLWQSRETPTFRPFFFFTIFARGKWSYFYHWLPFFKQWQATFTFLLESFSHLVLLLLTISIQHGYARLNGNTVSPLCYRARPLYNNNNGTQEDPRNSWGIQISRMLH